MSLHGPLELRKKRGQSTTLDTRDLGLEKAKKGPAAGVRVQTRKGFILIEP